MRFVGSRSATYVFSVSGSGRILAKNRPDLDSEIQATYFPDSIEHNAGRAEY